MALGAAFSERRQLVLGQTALPMQLSQRQSKSDNPSTWGTYATAIAVVAAGMADGIGFMLKNSEIAAADLDHVRDAHTGELVGWAMALCAEADALSLYREITVSGCGLRFIGLANSAGKIHRKFTFNRSTRPGIELYRNCARYITISGLQEGPCETMGSIGNYLDTLLARYDKQPAPTPAPPIPLASGALATGIVDLNQAGPQTDRYRDLIENGAPVGDRSEKFQEVVWHLASQGWTAEQIADELARFPNGIGQKYAGRLLDEVTRSSSKWQGARRAGAMGVSAAVGSGAGSSSGSAGSASSSSVSGAPWPQIRVIAGELPRVVDEAEAALIAHGGLEIYQRGGKLVRPVLTSFKVCGDREYKGWRLIEITRPFLINQLCCAAQFLQYDKRAKKFVAIDAPYKVAETLLHRRGSWNLPRVAGIANAPFLHADGTIHDWEGYDPISGLFCKWDLSFPAIPSSPSKADAAAALEELKAPIYEFPFVTSADRAAALSAMLTAIDRRGMDIVPLHAFTAPTPGTGKSLLVEVIATMTTGGPAKPIDQSRQEDEFTKAFGAELISGASLIAIDNCQHVLEGSLLCIAVTQPVFGVRVLGASQIIEVPSNATIFANGNNLIIGADMTRRVIRCEMDAKVERPETREFEDDRLLDTVKANRGKLVVSALTVLRAWHLARANTSLGLQALDFQEWSTRVREALVWLEEDDPGSTMENARADDPYRNQRAVVLDEWFKALGEKEVLVRDVIATAYNYPDFYAALLTVAATHNGKEISPERLGRWLVKSRGSIVNNLTLDRTGIAHGGYSFWRVQKC